MNVLSERVPTIKKNERPVNLRESGPNIKPEHSSQQPIVDAIRQVIAIQAGKETSAR
ncbi:MAG: hypothetical protein HQL77_03880 [Magnetococcales bacterium]|nr:hypothetical protein [Magnetococcales bacterium]